MATNEQMKEEFIYFGEVWRFFKQFYDVQEDGAYWDGVVTEAGNIIVRHDCPLCRAVVLAVIDELERKRKEEKDRL